MLNLRKGKILISEALFWVVSFILLPFITIYGKTLSARSLFLASFIEDVFYLIWTINALIRSGMIEYIRDKRMEENKQFTPVFVLFYLESMINEIKAGSLEISQEQIYLMKTLKRALIVGFILIIYDHLVFKPLY